MIEESYLKLYEHVKDALMKNHFGIQVYASFAKNGLKCGETVEIVEFGEDAFTYVSWNAKDFNPNFLKTFITNEIQNIYSYPCSAEIKLEYRTLYKALFNSIKEFEEINNDPYEELKAAYASGKVIQWRRPDLEHLDYHPKGWHDCTGKPNWNINALYRVKEENFKESIKIIPFTLEDSEILRDKWIRHKKEKWEVKITKLTNTGANGIRFQLLLNDYEFMDGGSIGKVIKN